ncbi:MAG: bifunctional rhamnulose-1-phosphate aldolase/short-chain dehydrogenase [Candidatus Omnitrophica bacterium]|nr:bifunctional rhamnulose-1-phosphate aldolase/short-chain dehydrogenase [Candidatus Omnitrophota bacterium]
MQSFWRDREIKGKSPLELLVYRSRLIGCEPKLCVWGGGNTSSKMAETDHLGRSVRILRIKGSGSDLKSCQPKDFSPLKLEEVLPALKRTAMTDEEMVEYLGRCLLDAKAPRPSIEALLHAFLPYQAIDHTHADAILSLTNTGRPRQICKEVYGEELIFIPYVKPGFDLAKTLAGEVARRPSCKGAVLEKHGLITWAEDSKTSYLRTIEMVSRAERFLASKAGNKKAFGGQKIKPFSPGLRKFFIDRFMPEFRNILSRNKPVVLHFNDSKDVLEFVSSKNGPEVSQQGPATPDHMLRTKRIPCFLELTGDFLKTKQSFKRQLEAYASAHERYYQKYKKPGMFMLDPYSAVILIPGVGMVTSGKDLDSALITAEVYEHSVRVMRGASFVDRYVSLPPRQAFEIEYWPLELYKLSLAPPEKELARKIALITGACGGIGRVVARRLAASGAQVVVTDTDRKKVQELEKEINAELKAQKVLGIPMDVTSPSSIRLAFQKIAGHLGGLDVVVSNAGVATVAALDHLSLAEWKRNLAVNATGHFLVAREALQLMKRQKMGGCFIFMATKNVPAPGAEFGAYSASKAACAQLAKIVAIEGAPFGIRSNMVNPDGVFKESGLWAEIKKDRAKTFHIAEAELEEHYRKRNLLQVRVEPEDIAEGVLFLASKRSSKTTGSMLPVDGGLREAFPR